MIIRSLIHTILLSVLLLTLCSCRQQDSNHVYYLASDGNDTHNGLKPTSAWKSFKHAIKQVKPGDTVYIKAGLYTNNNLFLKNVSGTQEAPVAFIGYEHSPGDIQLSAFDPHHLITPEVPDHRKFPTINGEFKQLRYSGVEINDSNYIHLKNLHVTGYQSNVTLFKANHNLLENIIVSNAKDSIIHNGFGLTLNESSYNTLRYILAVSNQGENISFKLSHFNELEDCQSHGGLPGDDAGIHNATDYYIVITQSHNNTVRRCLARRHSSVEHGGHGIGIKARGVDSYENKVIDSVVRGISKGFYVNHHQTFNNEFINSTAYGDEIMPRLVSRGFIVRDGAHHNIFKGCKGKQLDFAIAFNDSPEDGSNQQEQSDTLFSNCEFVKTSQSVIFFEHSAKNNVFDKISVSDAPRLVMFNHTLIPKGKWKDNLLKNSRLHDVDKLGWDPTLENEGAAFQVLNIDYSYSFVPNKDSTKHKSR